ncbi:L,D-transpeptidase family protein [Parasediminibacterium sp. JCM 36343]|uniref:L,D-transpeptidase family protein n=1 Tax=Parasediminibacterium sp. JCM 36343 TaxID=3374279 RepID=UPI003979BF6E
MNRLLIATCIAALFFAPACKNKNKKDAGTAKADTTLYYFDSTQIKQFFNQHPEEGTQHEKLSSFYQKRDYSFAWINNDGVNEYAGSFINMLNQEQIQGRNDSAFYHDQLHTLYDQLNDEDYKFNSKDSLALQLELLLTANYFGYAKRNWKGLSEDAMKKAAWFIDRKKIDYGSFLDTVLDKKNPADTSLQPYNRQYGLLNNFLQQYKAIQKNGGWPIIPENVKGLKKGSSSPGIAAVKKQLVVMGDLAVNDTSILFDDGLTAALQKFQNRLGLPEDSSLNQRTVNALQVPVKERIQQILINMERSKWIPTQLKGDYLAVNIPEYKLHVYNNDNLEWSCNVVVGKSTRVHNSVIFNNNVETIVFSPYWNIPKGILEKEVLPGIRKNRDYLEKHNMEVVTFSGQPVNESAINWDQSASSFPYLVREKPGVKNSLGLVKFLFPNSYDIYLHDSPQKSLFDESSRAFSHGCIRVQEPFKLAKFLLRSDPSWTDAKINAAMNSGKEMPVTLKKKVPVFIAYFTAFVDRGGKLNFREDIYHHDVKMKQLMFVN